MSRSSLRIPAFLRSGVSLALAATMVVGAGAAEPPKGNAAAGGALSVTTDPDNADVYVDGRLAGQTPASLSSLSAGEHRVRIVKSGYLENARIVTLTAGAPTRLNVKLTKTNAPASGGGQVTSSGGGGGGFPWVWVGVGAAAAATVAVVALKKNDPPVPGTITAPANALMGAAVNFSAQGASDPDGDTLTYSWTFGDGGTATGATTSHAYTNTGAFTVTLTVSDGKHNVTAPTASINVRSLSATWRGTLTGIATAVSLTHSGTTLSGIYADAVGFAGTVSGTVSASGTVTFTINIPGVQPFTFTGTASPDINTLNGLANGSGLNNAAWVLTRS